jgi:hypothetical protein
MPAQFAVTANTFMRGQSAEARSIGLFNVLDDFNREESGINVEQPARNTPAESTLNGVACLSEFDQRMGQNISAIC